MRFSADSLPHLPFMLETELERTIARDPGWLEGIKWGRPRPGHPEGEVVLHIRDVLNNVDRFFGHSGYHSSLRLIALIHDTFKYKVVRSKPRAGKQSHGYWARQFAARYIYDVGILEVIELHDEAYKASRLNHRYTNGKTAEERARALVARLGGYMDLFMHFYLCDNGTVGKSAASYEWFKRLAEKYTS